ncbi:MAG: CapA family protein, partial [Anaerolineae bacterium]|nr:CapA family protein [Anaerolineae bacterium]
MAATTPPVSVPCLAVQLDLWEAQPTLFADLQREYPGCTMGPVEGATQAGERLQLGQSSLIIVSGESPRPDAELLRTEPFVLVSHVAGPSDQMSAKLVEQIFSEGGDWLPVVVGDGLVARELLGIDSLAPESIQASSWLEARELVMANRRLVTLLPWELVDFKVRALAVQGQPSISERAEIGMYERQWWLAGDVEGLPLLVEDLRERLKYEVEPLVRIVAVGDVMLGRGVASLMAANSPSFPFLRSRELTQGADITFGNLECAITSRGTPQGGISLRSGPEAAQALGEAGFDILSLANNHVYDYGAVGLADTVHYLQAEDIACVGLSAEGGDDGGPVILERGELRIAFLAFNHVGLPYALEEDGGPSWLDPELVYDEVRAAACEADFVVVSLHWGTEYVPLPDEFQQRVSRGILEAGAGLVLGHHPHVVGAVAFEDEGLVAYSLGNYVFDQPFSVETLQGMALRALIDGSGLKQLEFLPMEIVGGQPVLLPQAEADSVLGGLFRVSETVGGLPVARGEVLGNAPQIEGLRTEWSSRLPERVTALRLHDFEGDGSPEIVIAAGPSGGPNSIYVLDKDGSFRWAYTLGEQINDLECGDLEGDGGAEVVVGTGWLDRPGEILALDAEGRLRWRFGVEASVLDVALGNIDGDSA